MHIKEEDDDWDALSIFSDVSDPADRKRRQYDFHFSLPSPQPQPQLQQQQQQPMDVDTSGGPIRLSPLIASPRPGEKRQKLNSGRAKLRIRKLASGEDDSLEATHKHRNRGGGVLRKVFALRMLMCYSGVILVAVLLAMISKEDLREEFYKRYKKQYHALLYGVEDYCSQEFDFGPTAGALSARVVGQWEAIDRLAEIADRHQTKRCTSIALLGPTGVGKSLMAATMARHFQWPSNVHHFFWDFTVTAERRFERFQSFLYGMRHGREVELGCGRSLIVIDHLGSGDIPMVNKIDARLRFVADRDDVQLVVVYVFQGASLKDHHPVEQLNSGTIERVFLRPLNAGDLRQCIKLEADDLGVNLDERPDLLRELIASMEVEKYGCKAVRSKLAYYSKSLNNGLLS